MSREYRNLSIGFTVLDYEHLPEKEGEQMYADDVVEELAGVLEDAVKYWYSVRGKNLLASEPIL